jgi:hypothetical protein
MVGLVRAHWGLGSKTLTDLFAPDLSTEERQRCAALQRDSASPETAAALLELIYRLDVRELAGRVRAPTLVLHRKDDRAIGFDHGRELAALIPGATFAPLNGNAHFPWFGDRASVADSALAFLVSESRPSMASTIDENSFVREGEVWSIAFAGQRCHLKHARGLSDLALLLAHPDQEIAAARLMAGPDAIAPAGADPILDERARAELHDRLSTLDEAIARAEAIGDGAAATRASDERSALVRELRAATGLGGRRRALADPAERARKAVSGRIRESIEKLRAAHPELARHLEQSITTGHACAYRPPHALVWRT